MIEKQHQHLFPEVSREASSSVSALCSTPAARRFSLQFVTSVARQTSKSSIYHQLILLFDLVLQILRHSCGPRLCCFFARKNIGLSTMTFLDLVQFKILIAQGLCAAVQKKYTTYSIHTLSYWCFLLCFAWHLPSPSSNLDVNDTRRRDFKLT